MSLLAPGTEAEAAANVLEARAGAQPLELAGAGTRPVGRPVNAARTLSARALVGITLYEPAEMVIGARAGTPLSQIEATLAAEGQRLAFEPMDHRPLLGTSGEPTIGAVAAGNISGPRRIQAGAARDSLIGVRFVSGRGEILRSGGRVMKNVTGLDLVKLLAGSWGTLGFLTEVIFKVQPVPEIAATLVLEGLDDAAGIAALTQALGSPYEVTGAAHLPARADERPRTLIRLEGFADSVAYRFDRLRDALADFGPAKRLDGLESASLWQAVRDVSVLAAPQDHSVWRLSTAPTGAAEVAARIRQAVPAARLFHDWGGGLIWAAVPADGDACAGAVRAALAPAGGHATLIRAPEPVRAMIAVFQPLPEALMRLQESVRASLDPDRVFSPGRMYAEP